MVTEDQSNVALHVAHLDKVERWNSNTNIQQSGCQWRPPPPARPIVRFYYLPTTRPAPLWPALTPAIVKVADPAPIFNYPLKSTRHNFAELVLRARFTYISCKSNLKERLLLYSLRRCTLLCSTIMVFGLYEIISHSALSVMDVEPVVCWFPFKFTIWRLFGRLYD